MKIQHHNIQSKVTRLGSGDIEDQVNQAIAYITLDGLQPSDYAIHLAYDVAMNLKSTEEAIAALHDFYACRTD